MRGWRTIVSSVYVVRLVVRVGKVRSDSDCGDLNLEGKEQDRVRVMQGVRYGNIVHGPGASGMRRWSAEVCCVGSWSEWKWHAVVVNLLYLTYNRQLTRRTTFDS